MGRFLNTQKRAEDPPAKAPQPIANDLAPAPTPATVSAAQEENPSAIHWLGMWGLCFYSVSWLAVEFSIRAFGGNPHLAMIDLIGMFGAFLITGGVFRSLRDKVGRIWWGFLIWLLVCIPFSTWRTGSILMLTDYIPRSHMLLFFLSAFLLNLKQCRIFMLFSALSSYCLLLWCYLHGVMDPASGRLMIPGSLFYANANDLGSQLVISLGSLLYLCTQRSLFFRVCGLIGFPITLLYLLKTGSRGSAVACVAFAAVAFFYSRGMAKIIVIAGVVATLAVAVVIIPSSALSRLALVFLHPEEEVRSEQDYSQQQIHDIGSQIARWQLLKLSVWYTVTNPVFGVGPGVFVERVAGDDAKKSQRSGWVGTHNSYTQVSSESGLPGAFCYIAVLWLTLRTARRLLAQSRDHPALSEVNKMAFSLLSMTATFAVSALFHHIAFTGYLALLAGQVLALGRASQPLLERSGRLVNPSRPDQL